MHSRKQLAEVIEQIINTETIQVESSTIDDYKKLNDKCDDVINKIKHRKSKKINGG